MKILLLGNIGSGKTSMGTILSEKLGLPFITIDNLRNQFSDGTIAGEYLSLHHFMQYCQSEKSIILETSGVGCHKHSTKKALENSKDEIFIITIFSDIELNQKRIKGKKRPPHPWPLDIENLMKKTESELEDDFKHKFWFDSNKRFRNLSIENKKDGNINSIVEEIITFVKN